VWVVTDFTQGYVPPGVYIASQTRGSVSAIGIGATVICLVGRGQGYQPYAERMTLDPQSGTAALTQQGVKASSVVVTGLVPLIDDGAGNMVPDINGVPGRYTFIASEPDAIPPITRDYQLDQDQGDPVKAYTRIVREPSGSMTLLQGDLTVSYQFTSQNYYALNSFLDYATFQSIYGAALDPSTGQVNSPLSLAAQYAFQNGANMLYAVAIRSDDPSDQDSTVFDAAYGLTMPNYDINVVVPLCEDAVTSANSHAYSASLTGHLQTANSQGFPRIALYGLPKSYNSDPSQPDEPPDWVAGDINYRRVMFIWPQEFTFYNPIAVGNAPNTLDGYYFAAAAAGVLANNSPAQGLTRQNVRGFAGLPVDVQQACDVTSKNKWSSSGVAVAEVSRQGGLVIRHGVTTDMSNIANRELSIVRCQDSLFQLMQITLDSADMIGSPITANTPLDVKGLVQGALETALLNNIIQGYTNLLVSQQTAPSGDPSIIAVTFDYSPTYPLNYISVVFTLNLSTGTLSVTSDTTGAAGATAELINPGA
jgi:hypothetical protein